MANPNSTEGYSPDMDPALHEDTYRGFVHFTEVGVVFVLSIVASLALGGAKHAWLSCVLGVILAHIAVAIGLFSPRIGWRAGAGVLGLILVMLALY